jgi:hypothetical protein
MRHGSTRFASLIFLALSLPASAVLATEENALPDARRHTRVTPLLLLSRSDVRDDLGLSESQTQAVELAIQRFHTQAQGLRGLRNDAETISARRKLDEEVFAWIDSRLLPAQKTRLVQIDLQWEGPSILVSRSIVSETLHLSVEQKLKLKTAIQSRDLALKSKQSDAELVLEKAALACLTEAQRESWRAMLGKPVEFRKPGL